MEPMSEEVELTVHFKVVVLDGGTLGVSTSGRVNPQTIQMGLLNNFLESISNRTTEAREATMASKGKGKSESSSHAGNKEPTPPTKGWNAELVDLKVRHESSPLIFDRQVIVGRLQTKVCSDLAPFVANVLDQTKNTYCRLGWAKAANEDIAFHNDCLRHNKARGNLLAERCSAVMAKMSVELQTLRME
uniref:Uncharacterized protein n=1 Tax=Cannabis sativa TaxID=3483 RepID=A0A803NTE2_CANSA